MNIEETLEQRGQEYGSFKNQSSMSQMMENVVRSMGNFESLEFYQQEAIKMMLHKIARICNGNPYYLDSWRDIIGYCQLALDLTSEHPRATDIKVEKYDVNDLQN